MGEAADGARAVELARDLRPDVVVMDLRMPGTDGIAATAQIVGDPDLAEVHVLVLTTFEDDEHVIGALRAGAAGFLGKGVRPQVLVDAVRTVAAGDSLLSPQATRSLIARAVTTEPRPGVDGAVFRSLTDREREVVLLVAQGLSNDDISARLHVTPLTAKTHVNRAMSKLGPATGPSSWSSRTGRGSSRARPEGPHRALPAGGLRGSGPGVATST